MYTELIQSNIIRWLTIFEGQMRICWIVIAHERIAQLFVR